MLVVVRLKQINRQKNSGKLTVLVAVRLTVEQIKNTLTDLVCWLLVVRLTEN